MDAKDRKLLYFLERDGRMPISELARKTRLSKQVASYRINNLIEKGAILGFTTQLDITRLGYTNYEVWMQLATSDPKVRKELIKYFVDHPNTRWVAECGGKWDIVVSVLARNISHFNEIFFKGILRERGINIQHYYINTVYEMYHYSRSYLLGSEHSPKEVSFSGGDKPVERLDPTDLALLERIATDARVPTTVLARDLGISPKTAALRIKKLRERRVIQSFMAILQPSRIGFQHYEILIEVRNYTAEREKAFLAWAESNPYVIFFIKCIGRWDLDIAFDVRDSAHLQEFIADLRNRFADVILDYEVVQVTNHLKIFHEFPKELRAASRRRS